jgi:arginyl-tRNA synthetase
MSEQPIRVWFDRKRGHYVSNAAFVAARRWGCSPQVAAAALAQWLKSAAPEFVADAWAS